MGPFHADSLQKKEFHLLKKEDMLTYYLISSVHDFLGNTEFWMGTGREFPHFCRQAQNILLDFAISYLCDTGFSAAATIESKYRPKSGKRSHSRYF
jgi:hypothetical protein